MAKKSGKSIVAESPTPMPFEPSLRIESNKSDTVNNIKIGQEVPIQAIGKVESLSSDEWTGKTTYSLRMKLRNIKVGKNSMVGMNGNKAVKSIANLKKGGKGKSKKAMLKSMGSY